MLRRIGEASGERDSGPSLKFVEKWNQNECEEKDLWIRWVSSVEWKAEGVIDGESEDWNISVTRYV